MSEYNEQIMNPQITNPVGLWLGTVTILCVGVCMLPAPAAACDPAPDHQVAVVADDTPECVTVRDAFNYGSGALSIDNQCADTLTVAGLDCPTCDDPVDIAPGTEEWFTVETRTVADGISEGSVNESSLSWTLVDQSGTVEVAVTIYDNSDACDDWNNTGCEISGGGAGGDGSSGVWFVAGLLGLVWWRRSRAVASR